MPVYYLLVGALALVEQGAAVGALALPELFAFTLTPGPIVLALEVAVPEPGQLMLELRMGNLLQFLLLHPEAGALLRHLDLLPTAEAVLEHTPARAVEVAALPLLEPLFQHVVLRTAYRLLWAHIPYAHPAVVVAGNLGDVDITIPSRVKYRVAVAVVA
jgi:hypothetical protein